jgi:hypothetical protein
VHGRIVGYAAQWTEGELMVNCGTNSQHGSYLPW